MQLSEFNSIGADEAAQIVRSCAHVDRWAFEVVAGRPYGSIEELLEATQTCANPWTDEEIDSALARHPRIGQRAGGESADAEMSRREQARLGITDDVQRQLDEQNAAYEEKFGFVFLIRAAGRSAEEILAELTERMSNPPQEERRIAAEQLRQISALRLEGVFS